MARMVIDPVTRIEGHLRVEVTVDGGVVTEAYSSSTMWRGIQKMLAGRASSSYLGMLGGAVDVSGLGGERWWLTASFKPLRR